MSKGYDSGYIKRPTQKAQETPATSAIGETDSLHPAFAVLQLNRSNWSPPGTVLAGSALHHHTTITIALKRARMVRGFGDERFYEESRGTIAEVEMSEAQWARFIASSGIGSGVPCTLRTAPVPGSNIDHWVPYIEPPASPHEKANDDAVTRAAKVIGKATEALDLLRAALARPNMTKAEVKAAAHALELGIQHFASGTEFYLQQFQEATDHVVADAKSEVEAFVNRVAVNTGLQALRDGAAPVLMLDVKQPGE